MKTSTTNRMSRTLRASMSLTLFFFNVTATTEIYTLSLHDALPISELPARRAWLRRILLSQGHPGPQAAGGQDRKSTRLNSSHSQISYAVFCLKKKKKQTYCRLK